MSTFSGLKMESPTIIKDIYCTQNTKIVCKLQEIQQARRPPEWCMTVTVTGGVWIPCYGPADYLETKSFVLICDRIWSGGGTDYGRRFM